MNLISFFRRPSSTAPVARERLQILLAHERAVVGKSDLIAILQDEIVAVIAKHFPVEPEAIKVKMERGDAVSTLEVEVEIPTPMCVNLTLNAPKPNAAAKPNGATKLNLVTQVAEKPPAVKPESAPEPAKPDAEQATPVELPAEADG
jgi:cell division topological specificity factor